MSLQTLLVQDLVIHRYQTGAVDAEGNQIESFDPAIGASSPIAKGYVQPPNGSSQIEQDQGRKKVISKPWKVYLFPDAVVDENDRITWQSRVLDVKSVYDTWAPTLNHHKKVELEQSGWVQ